jgi:hypothetical protein
MNFMKSKDQLLLEHAYQQIMLNEQIHQKFLTEAGLLDKAKQVGGAIVDKAKAMFRDSVDGLLGIIKKADPKLFAKIQQAVQQKDEQTLQAIFKDPQVKQQQQLAQESLLKEGVVDSVKNLYAKASNFLTERPDVAVKLALAGILTAIAATGPQGMSHMAGALAELAGRTLGGGAIGAAIGGTVGGIRDGWEGAKKGMKKGFGIGAGVGLASGTQNLMAHGASSIEDVISNLASAVSPDEAQQLAALKNKLANANLSPEETKDVLDTLKDNIPTKEKIEFVNDLLSAQKELADANRNTFSQETIDSLTKGTVAAAQNIADSTEIETEEMFKRTEKLQQAINKTLEGNQEKINQIDKVMKALGLIK